MALKMTPTKEGERKERASSDYELAPVGNHLAILYAIYELGTQWHPREEPGKQWYPEVRFYWELCDELMSDGRPFAVNKTYRASLYETSQLAKDLKAWLPAEFIVGQEFDLSGLVGRACMVNVSHSKPNFNGTVYANVDAITALNKRTAQPDAQHNPNRVYEIEMGPPGDEFPEYLRKKIMSCREFAGNQAMMERPADPSKARPSKPPTSGGGLFAWAKGLEDSGTAKGVVNFINEWGRGQGLAEKMKDWALDDVQAAHAEALRHFLSGSSVAAPEAAREPGSDDNAPANAPAPRPSAPGGTAPRSGKALFAWSKDMEARFEVGLLKYLNGWAKLQEFPERMIDWDGEQVALAYAEAVRKLRSIKPDADLSPAPNAPNLPPVNAAAPNPEALSNDPDDDIPF